MYDLDSRLLPKRSMISWIAIFLLPLVLFIFLIVSGYINTPPEQAPFLIKLMAPHRLLDFSLFVCIGIVWTADTPRRRKVEWSVITVLAIFLQSVAFNIAMMLWYFSHDLKN